MTTSTLCNGIDVLNDSFLQLRISNEPNERKRVVRDIAKAQLNNRCNSSPILENHKCFEPARLFRDKWRIDRPAWDDFVQLLSGYEHFPLLLLQNPANSHHQSYEDMTSCPTITWISKTLKAIGLTLNDVPILDICSFFSDQDLMSMDETQKHDAVEASYKLAEDIIELLRPTAVVSCQCKTLGAWDEFNCETWRRAQNKLARDLCSSVSRAKNRETTKITCNTFQFWSVWGFHPRYHGFGKNKENEKIMIVLLEEVYGPCSSWKRNDLQELLLSELASALAELTSAIDDHCSAVQTVTNEFMQFVKEGH